MEEYEEKSPLARLTFSAFAVVAAGRAAVTAKARHKTQSAVKSLFIQFVLIILISPYK